MSYLLPLRLNIEPSCHRGRWEVQIQHSFSNISSHVCLSWRLYVTITWTNSVWTSRWLKYHFIKVLRYRRTQHQRTERGWFCYFTIREACCSCCRSHFSSSTCRPVDSAVQGPVATRGSHQGVPRAELEQEPGGPTLGRNVKYAMYAARHQRIILWALDCWNYNLIVWVLFNRYETDNVFRSLAVISL